MIGERLYENNEHMTPHQITIIGLLSVALFLFIWGRWRYDFVAFSCLMAGTVLGIVDPEEAFMGFGHPATVTVIFVLILGHSLAKSGATDIFVKLIFPVAHIPALHIGILTVSAAFLSAFMNNVGALVLLMPIAVQSGMRVGTSPSRLLMPIAFGSILGGMTTLIGTPPNIIIATYREKLTNSSYEMFDFTPLGGSIAVIGILFIVCVGWRLIQERKAGRNDPQDIFEIEGYIFEAKISKESKIVGKNLEEVENLVKDLDVVIASFVRNGRQYSILSGREIFQAGDILIVESQPEGMEIFVNRLGLTQIGRTKDSLMNANDTQWIELVVMPHSKVQGRVVDSIKFRSRYGVNLLAVSRKGKPYRGRLKAFRFEAGDVMLLHGDAEHLPDVANTLGCLPLAGRKFHLGKRNKKPLAIAVFLAAISLTAFGVLSFPIALGLGVVGVILLNVISLRELVESVDWPTVILIGSMIPLGKAFEETGTSQVLVDYMLSYKTHIGPSVALGMLMFMTMILTAILNNAATAVLMAPIASQFAIQFNANPDAFLMAVAISSSCAFITPIAHQNNALVMGPGGYKFSDYVRVGTPLQLLLFIVMIPLLIYFWPL